jgi:hypothetical protein
VIIGDGMVRVVCSHALPQQLQASIVDALQCHFVALCQLFMLSGP